MASDYARAPDTPARTGPTLGIFDGLKLKVELDRTPPAATDRSAVQQTPDRHIPGSVNIDRPSSPSPAQYAAAVERHGKIVSSMRFAHHIGNPYTPQQRSELIQSRTALDALPL